MRNPSWCSFSHAQAFLQNVKHSRMRESWLSGQLTNCMASITVQLRGKSIHFFFTDTRTTWPTHVCHILASLVEGSYPPCHCSVRQCRFPASLLKTLMTLSCCTASGTFNFYPTPLFLFWKHCDNTTLDRRLTQGSVLLVTAHARDVGRESPFSLR